MRNSVHMHIKCTAALQADTSIKTLTKNLITISVNRGIACDGSEFIALEFMHASLPI